MMDLQLFFDNFETIAAAPNGVKKLRELILQLAVRGKLVPQDPADEPAEKLLERIREKNNLVESPSKSSKRSQKDSQIQKLKNCPCEIPKNWEWASFQQIAVIASNLVQPDDYRDLPHVAPDNIEKHTGRLLAYRTVREDSVISNNHRFFAGQILYSKIRPNLSKVVSVDFDGLCSADMYPINAYIEAKYLINYMLSNIFLGMAIKNDTRVAMPKINQDELNKILVPVPPIEEQKRIVAKVDELMKLCDRLEAQQQQNRSHLTQMQKSAIAQLLSAPDADAFAEYWQDIVENFELLFDDGGAIGDLRSAIVQLAVQGELSGSKQPFKIGKVSGFVKVLNGYAFKSEWFLNRGIKLLRNANVGHGDLNWKDVVHISEQQALEYSRYNLDEGDVVISLDRPIISTGLKVARISKADLPCLLLQRVGKVEFLTNDLNSDFFFLWLQLPMFIDAIDPGRSNGVPHISSKSIESLPLRVPPLAEQKRIVAKVNQLMTLCDTLQAHLTQRQQSAIDLAEVAVQQVLDWE